MSSAELKGYGYQYCGIGIRNQPPILKEHIYSFLTGKKNRYIVRVEEHENDLFVIKFHLKAHKNSESKYVILTHFHDAPRKIIYTCILIGLSIVAKNPKASFGFIGSPTIPELSRAKSERLSCTKRFKIYTKFAYTLFSPDNYKHFQDQAHSSYLLLSKKKLEINPALLEDIQLSLETHYRDIEQMFSNILPNV
jgi:hypothetical protein